MPYPRPAVKARAADRRHGPQGAPRPAPRSAATRKRSTLAAGARHARAIPTLGQPPWARRGRPRGRPPPAAPPRAAGGHARTRSAPTAATRRARTTPTLGQPPRARHGRPRGRPPPAAPPWAAGGHARRRRAPTAATPRQHHSHAQTAALGAPRPAPEVDHRGPKMTHPDRNDRFPTKPRCQPLTRLTSAHYSSKLNACCQKSSIHKSRRMNHIRNSLTE